jgi:hypothetical protein
MTPAEAIELAGKGYRLIGVAGPTEILGFEVLNASDKVVARFNRQNQEVDRLLPEGDDMPPPPRMSGHLHFDCTQEPPVVTGSLQFDCTRDAD